MRLRASVVLLLPALGCIPMPGSELTGSESALPYDATDPYLPGDTDWSTTGATDSGRLPDTDGATQTDGAGSQTDGAGTDSADATGSDTGSTGEDTGPVGEFDPPLPFGDDLAERELVGTWGAPWDPAGLADFTLTIQEDGRFEWRETSGDCSVDLRATGVLWIESTQIVMHVETWNKRMPWDTQGEIGLKVWTPFRLKLGYTRFNTYLGLAGPRGLTEMWDWQGRSFDRVDAGTGPQGRWASQAELWALVDGPTLVVRDEFIADLQGSGDASVTRQRTWWWPGPDAVSPEPEINSGPWEDLSPGSIAGAATIDGRTYAYDAAHLFTFASGQSLRLGVESDC